MPKPELEAQILWNRCPLCNHPCEPGCMGGLMAVRHHNQDILFHADCLEPYGEGHTPLDLLEALEIKVTKFNAT